MEKMQDVAYNSILNQILSLKLTPGQRVSDKDFEMELGMSRTPVREAMLRLDRNGLLLTVPQSGTYVTKIDLKKALDARYVRQLLEKSIIKELTETGTTEDFEQLEHIVALQDLAIKKKDTDLFFKLDNEFHSLMYKLVNRENIWNWLGTFSNDLTRFRSLRTKDTSLSLSLLSKEHLNILKSIKSGDSQKSAALIGQHLNLMLSEKSEVLKTFPDYFVNS